MKHTLNEGIFFIIHTHMCWLSKSQYVQYNYMLFINNPLLLIELVHFT